MSAIGGGESTPIDAVVKFQRFNIAGLALPDDPGAAAFQTNPRERAGQSAPGARASMGRLHEEIEHMQARRTDTNME
jgi:hypothetical protein